VSGPDPTALRWVADVMACGEVTVLRGLSEGASPWLLRAGDREVVLRVGQPGDAASLATEAAALRLAAGAGISVPGLLGADCAQAAGVPLLLTGRLPGSRQIPRDYDAPRLRRLGALAARIHSIPLEPSPALPARDQPAEGMDFARMRREQGASPLLRAAEEVVAAARPAFAHSVLIHGDLWLGNMLWSGGRPSGVLDWEFAGSGAPGLDLGYLRCDATLCFGTAAAAAVLDGWEEAAGRAAADIAYWDAVAALATPPDLGFFPALFADHGRPDLDQALLLRRRDAFLRQALAGLAAASPARPRNDP
jgi:aminoglycoside phosphotransferase (APT) family kinase protein